MYYHGGCPNLPINGQLLPSSITGRVGYCTWAYERGLWSYSGSRDNVFITQDYDLAFLFASFWTYCKCRVGCGALYQVIPDNQVEGHGNDLWCTSATIVDIVIPQVTMAQALKVLDMRHRMVLDLMAKEFTGNDTHEYAIPNLCLECRPR